MNRTGLLLVLVGTFVGCGGDRPWSTVEVSGKITYEDGSLIPAPSIQLMFKSLAEPLDGGKTNPRLGKTGVNVADGSFAGITTYTKADGLIPGKHKVVVIAMNPDGRSRSRAVPREYGSASKTPLELDTNDSPVHLKIRKP